MLIDEMTTEKIYLPGAPSLPGLTFRSFHGEDDYPIMADVTNACYTADQTGEIVTLDWIANFCRHLANFDPQRDLLFAEVDGLLIAYNRMTSRKLDDGTRLYVSIGFVLPGGTQASAARCCTTPKVACAKSRQRIRTMGRASINRLQQIPKSHAMRCCAAKDINPCATSTRWCVRR